MKKKMIIALCLALSLTLALCACGTDGKSDTPAADGGNTGSSISNQPSNIGEENPDPSQNDVESPDDSQSEIKDEKPSQTEKGNTENKETEAPVPSKTEAKKTEASKTATKKTEASQTKAPTKTEAPKPSQTQALENKFSRPYSDAFCHSGQWSVYLREAYWRGNDLVVSIFITNGESNPIKLSDLGTKYLRIKNSKGQAIAEGNVSFDDFVLQPGHHVTVDFVFTAAKGQIKVPGANLRDNGLDIWIVKTN